jgi:hypothetical protein
VLWCPGLLTSPTLYRFFRLEWDCFGLLGW